MTDERRRVSIGVIGGSGLALTADLLQRRLAPARPVIRRAIEGVAERISEGSQGHPRIAADAIAEVLARPAT